MNYSLLYPSPLFKLGQFHVSCVGNSLVWYTLLKEVFFNIAFKGGITEESDYNYFEKNIYSISNDAVPCNTFHYFSSTTEASQINLITSFTPLAHFTKMF